MTSDKKIGSLIAIVLLVALYVFLFMLDNALPSNSTTVMLITVLKKGAIYALVCVSMNPVSYTHLTLPTNSRV